MAKARWFNVEITNFDKAILGNTTLGRYLYAKKNHDGRTVLFNGKHYIHIINPEDAKKCLKIDSLVKDQDGMNMDFDFYLNY